MSLQTLQEERAKESMRREPTEATPLQRTDTPRGEFRRALLIRQTSVMETPVITDATGAMKITYWF